MGRSRELPEGWGVYNGEKKIDVLAPEVEDEPGCSPEDERGQALLTRLRHFAERGCSGFLVFGLDTETFFKDIEPNSPAFVLRVAELEKIVESNHQLAVADICRQLNDTASRRYFVEALGRARQRITQTLAEIRFMTGLSFVPKDAAKIDTRFAAGILGFDEDLFSCLSDRQRRIFSLAFEDRRFDTLCRHYEDLAEEVEEPGCTLTIDDVLHQRDAALGKLHRLTDVVAPYDAAEDPFVAMLEGFRPETDAVEGNDMPVLGSVRDLCTTSCEYVDVDQVPSVLIDLTALHSITDVSDIDPLYHALSLAYQERETAIFEDSGFRPIDVYFQLDALQLAYEETIGRIDLHRQQLLLFDIDGIDADTLFSLSAADLRRTSESERLQTIRDGFLGQVRVLLESDDLSEEGVQRFADHLIMAYAVTISAHAPTYATSVV